MLIQQWIVASKMRLNHSKSTVIWFKVSSRFPDIVVDDTALQVVTKQKISGIILDNCLSWNHHVSHICKKMLHCFNVINKHQHVLSSGLTKLLVDPLIFSYLNYSLPVWEAFFASKSVATIEGDAKSGCSPMQKSKEI